MASAAYVQQPLTPERDDGRFDLQRLFRTLRSRARLMAAIFVVIVGAAAAFAFTAKTSFTATSTLMIDQPKQTVLTAKAGADEAEDPAATLVETRVAELQSPTLARAVVTELHLDRDPEFNLALAPPSLMAKLRQTLTHAKPAPQGPAAKPVDPVVDTLLGKLRVSHVGTSYLVTISVKSLGAAKAAKIANTFAELFITSQRDAKIDIAEEGRSWLSERLDMLRLQVQDADTALQQYKIANNLMSAQGATLTEQEISGLDQQQAQARAQQAEAEARLATAKQQMARGSTGDDVGEALNSPVIQQLRQKRADTSQRLADLQGRYGDRHPDLLKARRELADTDSQIQAEIGRVVSNLEAQAQVARQRTNSIVSSVNQSRSNLAQNNRAMVNLEELQRNADAARLLYETFLNKYKETSAVTGLQRSDAHVVDLARTPSAPSEPKRGLILMFGVMMGLTTALGVVLLAEQLYTGMTDVDSVEVGLDRTYLGSIPTMMSTLEAGEFITNNPLDYLIAKPLSSFAESFRSLNAAVNFSRGGGVAKVVAVTSSLPDEGKTTTCICMGRIAALSGLRTVVVDCDLRQRSINRMLKTEPVVGLVDVLLGESTLDQALMLDEPTGMQILPLAKTSASAVRDVFSTQAMADLIATLSERFDLVILDTGPVVLVTNTRVVTRYADAVVLLVRWRKTSRRLARTSLRLLDAASAPVVGVALTQVDLKRTASVDPADPSSYYRTYKKYYAA